MVKYHSGLETVLANQQSANNGTPDVVIAERRDVKIIQLSFFETQQALLKKELSRFGVSDVPHFSMLKSGKLAGAARVEMSKIWLISDEMPEGCDAALYPLDLSSSRAVIRLSGLKAPEVMARICAVDFRDKTRNFYSANMHHVGVHIHHHNDSFDIYMPRSFAQSLTELLLDISCQYHVQMA